MKAKRISLVLAAMTLLSTGTANAQIVDGNCCPAGVSAGASGDVVPIFYGNRRCRRGLFGNLFDPPGGWFQFSAFGFGLGGCRRAVDNCDTALGDGAFGFGRRSSLDNCGIKRAWSDDYGSGLDRCGRGFNDFDGYRTAYGGRFGDGYLGYGRGRGLDNIGCGTACGDAMGTGALGLGYGRGRALGFGRGDVFRRNSFARTIGAGCPGETQPMCASLQSRKRLFVFDVFGARLLRFGPGIPKAVDMRVN